MRRSGGLKRGAPLRARSPLKRTKPLANRSALAPGKPLERKTPLRSISPRRRLALAWGELEKDAHAEWRRQVCRGRCAVCLRDGRKRDAHRVHDPHHVLPARYIRRHVRSLRLPAQEAKRLAISLLYDPRNGLNLDRLCHERHETAYRRVPREAIPRKAWQFARELGLEHVLERLYPE